MSRPVWAGAGDGGAHSKRQAQLLFQGIKAPGLKSNQSQVETARRLAADHASLRPEIESRRAIEFENQLKAGSNIWFVELA